MWPCDSVDQRTALIESVGLNHVRVAVEDLATYSPAWCCRPHTCPICAEYGGLVEVSGAYEAKDGVLAAVLHRSARARPTCLLSIKRWSLASYLVFTYAVSRISF